MIGLVGYIEAERDDPDDLKLRMAMHNASVRQARATLAAALIEKMPHFYAGATEALRADVDRLIEMVIG